MPVPCAHARFTLARITAVKPAGERMSSVFKPSTKNSRSGVSSKMTQLTRWEPGAAVAPGAAAASSPQGAWFTGHLETYAGGVAAEHRTDTGRVFWRQVTIKGAVSWWEETRVTIEQ